MPFWANWSQGPTFSEDPKFFLSFWKLVSASNSDSYGSLPLAEHVHASTSTSLMIKVLLSKLDVAEAAPAPNHPTGARCNCGLAAPALPAHEAATSASVGKPEKWMRIGTLGHTCLIGMRIDKTHRHRPLIGSLSAPTLVCV